MKKWMTALALLLASGTATAGDCIVLLNVQDPSNNSSRTEGPIIVDAGDLRICADLAASLAQPFKDKGAEVRTQIEFSFGDLALPTSFGGGLSPIDPVLGD